MLPKKLHIEPIERFHKTFKEISDRIREFKNKENLTEEEKEERHKLLSKYFLMINLWSEIDDFCEMVVDHKLNLFENEEEINWE